MTYNRNQPRAYDVVLGGQTPTPMYGAILGGLLGVKQRLSKSHLGDSPSHVVQRVNALKDALNYGVEGLELVIEALKDSSWRVQRTAFSLLQGYQEPIVIQALQEYNPYDPFQCLYRYPTGKSTTYAIAITPDGQVMVSGGNDRIITLRHLGTGRILRTLTKHTDSIYALCLSNDGQILASSGRDEMLHVWNLQAVSNYNSISPTGRSIGDGLTYSFTGHSDSINCIAISPNGKILLSGSEDSTIHLWNLETGKFLACLEEHEAGVKAIALTPDGKMLVSASADHTIKLWQLPKIKTPTHTLTGHSDWVKCLAITPDSKILASGSQDKTIKLWDLATGELKSTLVGHWGEVNRIVVSPDGQTLISCSRDETIQLWHLSTGKHLHTLSGHQGAVATVAISPDGHPLVSSSWDHTIRVWGMKG